MGAVQPSGRLGASTSASTSAAIPSPSPASDRRNALTLPVSTVNTDGNFTTTWSPQPSQPSASSSSAQTRLHRVAGVSASRSRIQRHHPPVLTVPGLGSVNLKHFTIKSDGTFAITASTSTRIGPNQLSIRNASIASAVRSRPLNLRPQHRRRPALPPLGNPIGPPNLTIRSTANPQQLTVNVPDSESRPRLPVQ